MEPKSVLEARPSVLSAAIFGEPEAEQQRSVENSNEEQQVTIVLNYIRDKKFLFLAGETRDVSFLYHKQANIHIFKGVVHDQIRKRFTSYF